MAVNINEELQKTAQEMQDAETALLQMGFNQSQWEQIRAFILAAITNTGYTLAKEFQNPRK
jgi:hypothetical protein